MRRMRRLPWRGCRHRHRLPWLHAWKTMHQMVVRLSRVTKWSMVVPPVFFGIIANERGVARELQPAVRAAHCPGSHMHALSSSSSLTSRRKTTYGVTIYNISRFESQCSRYETFFARELVPNLYRSALVTGVHRYSGPRSCQIPDWLSNPGALTIHVGTVTNSRKPRCNNGRAPKSEASLVTAHDGCGFSDNLTSSFRS